MVERDEFERTVSPNVQIGVELSIGFDKLVETFVVGLDELGTSRELRLELLLVLGSESLELSLGAYERRLRIHSGVLGGDPSALFGQKIPQQLHSASFATGHGCSLVSDRTDSGRIDNVLL